MSAPVLLNLLNEMKKRDQMRGLPSDQMRCLSSDQMRGLPSILSLFGNKLKKFNTGVRMLYSIYHMTLK